MKNDIVAKFLINGGNHLLFSLFELDPMTSVIDTLFSQVNYNSVRKLMIMAASEGELPEKLICSQTYSSREYLRQLSQRGLESLVKLRKAPLTEK